MATTFTQDQIKTFADKLRTMDKTSAFNYVKQNSDVLKANPELAKAVSATYAEAFTNVKTPVSTFSGPSTPVPGNTMDTSTGAPYVAPMPVPTVTTPPIVTDIANNTSPVASYKFDHSKDVTVPGPTPAAFTPTKIIKGVAVNVDGQSTQQKYGLLSEQEAYILKLDKQNINKGLSVVDRQAAANKAIQDMQKLNVNKDTYGKIPTQFTDTVGDLTDLNHNGVPDSQEGFGLDSKSTAPENLTFSNNPLGTSYPVPTTFTDLESSFAKYTSDMASYETKVTQDNAKALAAVTDQNARNIIANNNAMIGSIQGLLQEKVDNNKQEYVDAVGAVYRQLGGQVKQFQRIIGTDGKAIDDATMLSLMGGVGVDSMAKVVDLKNQLIQQYLTQKDAAIKQIYELQSKNVIAGNDAAAGIAAINAQSAVDVLDMTKTFYQQMFGLSEQADANTTNVRTAVSNYLTGIGLTPLQQNQIINNYVKEGYTTEQAISKLSDDIRNGANPVINDVTKNNADAARAAQLKFNQDMSLKIEPIITKGKVDAALQDDKQAFEAAQNALDRNLKSRLASYGTKSSSGSKPLSEANQINASAQIVARGGAPLTGKVTRDDLIMVQYAASLASSDKASPEDKASAVTFLKGKGFKDTSASNMGSLYTDLSTAIKAINE